MQKVKGNVLIHCFQYIEFYIFLLLPVQYSLGAHHFEEFALRPVKLSLCLKFPSSWHDGCNFCACERPFQRPVCTSMICIDPETRLTSKSERSRQTSERLLRKHRKKNPEKKQKYKLFAQNSKKLMKKSRNERDPLLLMNEAEWSKFQINGLTHLSYEWLKGWTESCIAGSTVSPPGGKCVSCVCEEAGVASCEMKLDCVLNSFRSLQ
ncbi:uncharacterized protein LOC133532206 isoform X2 [Cydia pomonella]|uniref:uncharacterized protein LOC133532206 isoform X2 n=1 Tax=Cydia pomonella TaxID=82600 RepID=UPI002ADD682B|nr:uncharacterized protein LOC133532206 isoform X2 [Cydia pomonella]XP_061726757.1 uncharacterized protein LOC133532206 isoform X2 [Cydia pomonella]